VKEVLFSKQGAAYAPTQLAASPWHPSVLHGGAPAGLLAHCLEQAVKTPGFQPARLSIDLLRPVPMSALSVDITPIRQGKRIMLLEARLMADSSLVAMATALWVKPTHVSLPDYAPKPTSLSKKPEQLQECSFKDILFAKSEHMPPGLHTTVRLRPVSKLEERGRGTAWLALPVPIVQGYENTPFMLAALVSDFGNGVGQLNLGNNTGTINADILLQLSRCPEGEWIALDSEALLDASGVGQVISSLHDIKGRVGQVVQTIMPMSEFSG
jgi:hypothetical protein